MTHVYIYSSILITHFKMISYLWVQLSDRLLTRKENNLQHFIMWSCVAKPKTTDEIDDKVNVYISMLPY